MNPEKLPKTKNLAGIMASGLAAVSPVHIANTSVDNFTQERRKHRFTLFIGYGENAGSLLKRFEQLKCLVGITTNIDFLKHLLEFFEQNNPTLCNDNTVTIIHLNKDESPKGSSELKQIQNETFDDHDSFTKNLNINENLEEQPEEDCVPPPSKRLLIENEIDDPTSSLDPSGILKGAPVAECSEDQLTNFSFLSTNINFKAVKIITQYMEHIKKDSDYYHGFINSTEKLRKFLDDYRKITQTSFTVRSSRSYIKKRALNAVKALQNNVSLPCSDFAVGAMQTLESSTEGIEYDGGIQTASDTKDDNIVGTATDISANISISSETNELETKHLHVDSKQMIIEDSDLMDDSIITGPLRWEYVLGKPPIPFTGIPFFIIGNTQYQCFYASADIRTQRRKSELEKCSQDNPNMKPRLRRSLKRDCKAVMCIKSIVSFPEFTVEDAIHEVKSKKGCRKLKAAQLDKIRHAVEKGQSIGHPAFWVYVPLPEAHTTHDFETDEKSKDPASIDEITEILDVAARYGGKVHVVQNDGGMVELQITDVEPDLVQTENQEISSAQLLYFDEKEATTKLEREN